MAGENGTKAISTQDQMKLKLKFELSLAKNQTTFTIFNYENELQVSCTL